MGMPFASVQAGTQPQGKGAAQPGNPTQSQQFAEMQNQSAQAQAQTMQASSVYSPPQQNQQQGQPAGKGSSTTNAATSGQPQMGQPNMYPNTVGQWDNASIQPQQSRNRGGKGKG
jgi:hypothetical protein